MLSIEANDWVQIQGWEWKGSMCYWIKKQIEPFCMQHAIIHKNNTILFGLVLFWFAPIAISFFKIFYVYSKTWMD